MPSDDERSPDLREVMSVEDVADFLQLDPATVRALARRGELPGVKLGKHWRFLRDEILASLRPVSRSTAVGPRNTSVEADSTTISQEEAARLLGVSVRTIHRMIARGQLEKIPSPTGVARLSRARVQGYLGGPRASDAGDLP